MGQTWGVLCWNALGLAPLGPAPAQEFAFEVGAATELVKTMHVKHELQLESMGVVREGAFIPDPSGGWISSEQLTRVRDRYEAFEDGRPTAILRVYEESTNRGKLNVSRDARTKSAEENVSDSPFVQKGKTSVLQRMVRFTWVPAEATWSRRWERYDADESYLAEVTAEMDYFVLRPPPSLTASGLEDGASWDLSPEQIRDVFAPGGNTLLTPRSRGLFGRMMELGVGGDFADHLTDHPVVELARCTYKGVREQHGRRFAVIGVQIKFSDLADRTELYVLARSREEKRERSKIDSATVGYTLDGSGECLWDVEQKHLASFRFEGQERYTVEVQKTMSIGGQETQSLGQRSTFAGSLSFDFGCQRPDDLRATNDGAAGAEALDAATPPK